MSDYTEPSYCPDCHDPISLCCCNEPIAQPSASDMKAEIERLRKWDDARVAVIHELHERINKLRGEIAEANARWAACDRLTVARTAELTKTSERLAEAESIIIVLYAVPECRAYYDKYIKEKQP